MKKKKKEQYVALFISQEALSCNAKSKTNLKSFDDFFFKFHIKKFFIVI